MVKIIIVDDNDNIIGLKERSEAKKSAIYRTSVLWLTNSRGEVLITKRSSNKSYAGKRGMAAGGTVEEGETYDTNIEKEIKEELGIDFISYRKGPKLKVFGEQNKFCQTHLAIMDIDIADFTLQQDEVAEAKWVDKDKLINDVLENPDNYTPTMRELIKIIGNI